MQTMQAAIEAVDDGKLIVTDSSCDEDIELDARDFFAAYQAGSYRQRPGSAGPSLLKIRDYPPTKSFADVLPQHCQVRRPAAPSEFRL